MRQFLILLVFPVICIFHSTNCISQDILAGHKIKGLKQLDSLSILIQPGLYTDSTKIKEFWNMFEVARHKYIPDINISPGDSASAWLALSFITGDEVAFLELSVFRWIRILDTGEEIFSKVWWDSRLTVGGFSRSIFQESLDILLTSFAADYIRANP